MIAAHWAMFFAGMWVGGLLGVFVIALCAVADRADRNAGLK